MATRTSKMLPVPHPVSKDSPFADGYDIHAEAETLKHLIEADDPDMDDPLYSRFAEYCSRLDQLQRQRTRRRLRDYAEEVVPDNEAVGMNQIGTLIGEETDTMSLHTREAYRLFIGRSGDDSRTNGEISGKKVGAVLRAIWMLSASDNPYADQLLIATTERIDSLRRTLETEIAARNRLLEQSQQRGLKLSVMRSRKPIDVELGFRSPYGYMVAELILDFDFYARLIKTLTAKSRINDKEGRESLYKLSSRVRSIFEQLIPAQRKLMDDRLKGLCRADWSDLDDAACKRVRAATLLLGEVKREVFTGEILPRHTKRRVGLTAAQRDVLQNVSLTAETAPEDEEPLL
ncbi:PFL_4669 family integrating conjugative element protein [Cupriavidus basilensis]|uniref:Yfb n=1 Tax=Cupriavidus basilensis TaxID=68895 RepID=A0A0C4YA41_9BURK|nr:TIGR03761 family integrating conjugative element protein [Cupriavidus basilensis]AJG22347.1 Yfb [Cupriavidus basilensis]